MTEKNTPKAEVVTDPKAAKQADEKPAKEPTTTKAVEEKAEAKAEGDTKLLDAPPAETRPPGTASTEKAKEVADAKPETTQTTKETADAGTDASGAGQDADGATRESRSTQRTASEVDRGKAYRAGTADVVEGETGEGGDGDASDVDRFAGLLESTEHRIAYRVTGDADALDAEPATANQA